MYGRQTQHSVLLIPLLPAGDGRGRRSQLLFYVAVGCPFIQQKNDAHALRHARRQIPFPQVALQFAAFGRSQVQDFHFRHKYMTKKYRYLLLEDSPLVPFSRIFVVYIKKAPTRQLPDPTYT